MSSRETTRRRFRREAISLQHVGMLRGTVRLLACTVGMASYGCGAGQSAPTLSASPASPPPSAVSPPPPAPETASSLPAPPPAPAYSPPPEPGPLVALGEAPITTPNPRCPALGIRGWHSLPDFAPQCGYAIPTSGADLPPPIVWERCSFPSGLPKDACKQMQARGFNLHSAVGGIDGGGHTVLAFTRECGSQMVVVADADGPVRSALFARDYRGQISACTPRAPISLKRSAERPRARHARRT